MQHMTFSPQIFIDTPGGGDYNSQPEQGSCCSKDASPLSLAPPVKSRAHICDANTDPSFTHFSYHWGTLPQEILWLQTYVCPCTIKTTMIFQLHQNPTIRTTMIFSLNKHPTITTCLDSVNPCIINEDMMVLMLNAKTTKFMEGLV